MECMHAVHAVHAVAYSPLAFKYSSSAASVIDASLISRSPVSYRNLSTPRRRRSLVEGLMRVLCVIDSFSSSSLRPPTSAEGDDGAGAGVAGVVSPLGGRSGMSSAG